MRKILVGAIRVYQKLVSPWFGPHCRFYPSCSEWAREAIETYGGVRGLWLTLKRILSCHPFHPGGYEPLRRENG